MTPAPAALALTHAEILGLSNGQAINLIELMGRKHGLSADDALASEPGGRGN